MTEVQEQLEDFRKVANEAHGLSMQISDLAVAYAHLAMFATYIKARYPDAEREAWLFVENHTSSQEAANG